VPTAWTRVLLSVVLAAAVVGSVVAYRHWRPPAAPAQADDDPPRTYPTPYRNVSPEVRYVGDAACAGCHADQARTYRQHPMGRSFAPVAERLDQEHLDA